MIPILVNHAQIWFRRLRSGNFDAKDCPRSGRQIIENFAKIMDRHVSDCKKTFAII